MAVRRCRADPRAGLGGRHRHDYIGDAISNGTQKFGGYVGEDIVVDGVLHPAPPEVARLMRELEPLLGPDSRIRPDGQVVMGYDRRITSNCDLFRAAILEPSR